jgi:hypothetical protein
LLFQSFIQKSLQKNNKFVFKIRTKGNNKEKKVNNPKNESRKKNP